MKKKIIFALLLAGMSFATPSKVEAQAPKVVADVYKTWFDWYVTIGGVTINVYGCAGSGGDCYGA